MQPTETFWITMSGIITTFLGVVLRYAYKSKCQKVDLCGIHIERDITNEVKEDIAENTNTSSDTRTTLASPPSRNPRMSV